MSLVISGHQQPQALLVGPLIEEAQKNQLQNKVSYFSGPVILLDGALNAFETKPQNALAVGDGDSCQAEKKAWLDVVLPTDKDQSDLAYALENHLPQQLSCLLTLGLRGERLDHEMLNFGEISHFLSDRSQLFVSLERGLWAFAPGKYQLQLQGGFSLLPFLPGRVSLQGMIDYPLDSHPLKAMKSLGLSNRAFGEFELETEQAILFYEIQERNSGK